MIIALQVSIISITYPSDDMQTMGCKRKGMQDIAMSQHLMPTKNSIFLLTSSFAPTHSPSTRRL